MNHISLNSKCAGQISANTRPHHLHWGDWEMGTATCISFTKCSQVAGLVHTVGTSMFKHVDIAIVPHNFLYSHEITYIIIYPVDISTTVFSYSRAVQYHAILHGTGVIAWVLLHGPWGYTIS